MKILEVFGEPISNGGQESFVFNALKNMDLTDMHIEFFTPYYCDSEYYSKFVDSINGKIYALNYDFNPGKSRFNINKSIDSFFRKHRYDVVHIHSGSISMLAIFARYAKKNGCKKVIVHSHCSVEKVNLKNILLRYSLGLMINKNADCFCACSKLAAEHKFTKKIADKKAIIIKNGINVDVFNYDEKKRNEYRNMLNINDKTVVIGNVGRFSYQKNHEFLIDIFLSYHEKNPDSKLMLIGDGELRAEIESKIKKHNLESSIMMIGTVNNVQDYMLAMDIFVFPSRFEGFGIVAVEAQAVGLPVAASVAVPNDINVTKLVSFLNLNNSNEWSDKIQELLKKQLNRSSGNIEVRKLGFDIKMTAEVLRKIYIE